MNEVKRLNNNRTYKIKSKMNFATATLYHSTYKVKSYYIEHIIKINTLLVIFGVS